LPSTIPEGKVKNVAPDVKIQYLQFRKEEGEGGGYKWDIIYVQINLAGKRNKKISDVLFNAFLNSYFSESSAATR
jgi:hypothetical protein